ncbi:MAG: cysteine desulfurase family protein [Cellulosilyticum sp.]|nr:cysteine desulfurase family protein [Cellulosilyticum sp.]
MSKEIYLDNAATTRPYEEVAKVVAETMLYTYGNPSSLHKKGMDAENILKEASQFFARQMGALPEEIIYTSGGTESNNTAIIGAAMAYKRQGNKVITSAIEHPSVKEVFRYLEEQGFEVITVGVNEKGEILLDELKEAIDDKTLLVSIMHVNNEIGTIQNLEQIGQLIKEMNKETLFHVDAVQSFGKIPVHVKRAKIDFLSCSAHKFYGPRGVGLLYKNKAVRMQSLVYGGGQQKNVRSGTENVPGIAGTLKAAEITFAHQKEMLEHMKECKKYLATTILNEIPDTWLNGPSIEESAPYILNIGFKDVRSEVLLHVLENEGIYVSSGSACSSHKKEKDGVLIAIGNEPKQLDHAIRFSFSHDTQIEDLKKVVEVLKMQVPLLRRYTPGGRK